MDFLVVKILLKKKFKSNKFFIIKYSLLKPRKKRKWNEMKYQRNILFSFFSFEAKKLKEEDSRNCTDNRHWKNEKQVGMGRKRKKSLIRNKFFIIDLKLRSTNQNKTIVFANNHSTKQQQLRAFSFFFALCSLCILHFIYFPYYSQIIYIHVRKMFYHAQDNIQHNLF